MVDEDPMADLGARVDLHAGEGAPHLGEQPWQQRQAQPPQAVAEAVQHQGVEARVAEQDLHGSARGRVALLDHAQVGADRTQQPPDRAGREWLRAAHPTCMVSGSA